MPDPRLDFWTAAWNLAVDQHLSSATWKNSMQFLQLPVRQQGFLEALLRVLQQLPDDAGADIRILADARQKHDLEKVRGDWSDLPLSIRNKLEALARGEVKTIKPDWEGLSEPDPIPDEPFDEGERITSKLPYADHLGEVMNQPRYIRDPESVRGLRETIPVPGHIQTVLQQDSRRESQVPRPPQTGSAAAPPSTKVVSNDVTITVDEEWPEE